MASNLSRFKKSRPRLAHYALGTYIALMTRLLMTTMTALPLLLASADAEAQALVSTGESFVTPSILIGERAPDGERAAGLLLELAPGWKTYWRSPGEAGVPPRFDWSASRNLEDVRLAWPRPIVFDSFGMQTIGYKNSVALPLKLVPVDPDQPIWLEMHAELGVCHEMCVMEQITLALEILPSSSAQDAPVIAQALESVPGDGREAGLSGAECSISGTGRERAFDGAVFFDRPAPAATVIVEGTDEVWIHSTEAYPDDSQIRISAGVSLASDDTWIDRSRLRLTVLSDAFAADIRGCSAPAG